MKAFVCVFTKTTFFSTKSLATSNCLMRLLYPAHPNGTKHVSKYILKLLTTVVRVITIVWLIANKLNNLNSNERVEFSVVICVIYIFYCNCLLWTYKNASQWIVGSAFISWQNDDTESTLLSVFRYWSLQIRS